MEQHYLHSALREEYIEYRFLAELTGYAWSRGRIIEVMRAATDAFGYDLVLSEGAITRHVQLKASVSGGRAASQKIGISLAEKASGCVIWIEVESDTLIPTGFRWFGGAPNRPIGDLGTRVAKHTKADSTGKKAERSAHRIVPKGSFDAIDSIEGVFARLFDETE
ncbi:MAG: hypothetical protein ACU0BF_09325 [Paracoccaceae bacterium]